MRLAIGLSGALLAAGCASPASVPWESRWHPGPLPLLVGPRGPLAAAHNTPLFLSGWRLDFGQIPQSTAASGLRFFVEAPRPLQLHLVGQGLGPGQVQVEVNERPLITLKVDGRWRDYRFPLAEEQVRLGQNQLRLRSSVGCRWFSLEVVPLAEPRTFAGQPPRPEPGLHLPFGQSAEIPLRLDPDSWLEMSELKLWSEPGAPQREGAELGIRLCSGEPRWTQEMRWRPGKGLRGKVSALAPQDVSLVITAHPGPAGLKPGQLGLKLEGAALRSGQTQLQLPPPPPPRDRLKVARPPNVIFYLVDTLRADRLSCYGNSRATSPRIDELARDGIRFQQVMAQSSWTKPSVASIFTSLLPPDHRCLDFGDKLPDPVNTMAEVFSKAGYQVQGLVTNIYVSKSFGFGQGFDQFVCLPGAPSGRVHQQVKGWLEKSRDPQRPFFLYIHSLDPHSPYEPPARFLSDVNAPRVFSDRELRQLHNDFQKNPNGNFRARLGLAQRLYDDEVHYNDDSIGRLVDTLKELGLYEDTLIVVTSDHGEEFLDHGMMGHINSLYQELMLVPWILKLPAQAAAGEVVSEVWQQIDMAPTVLHHAGLEIPTTMQGLAWAPGVDPGRRPCFFSIDAGQDAVAFHQGEAPWKLKAQGVRLDPWVYLEAECSSAGRLQPRELYNLHLDPQQRKNLAYERPEVRAAMADMLNRRNWSKSGGDLKLEAKELYKHLKTLQYLR